MGADDQDLGAAPRELVLVPAQPRQVTAAEGSPESAEKDEHDGAPPAVIGEPDLPSLEIGRFEFGRLTEIARTLLQGALQALPTF